MVELRRNVAAGTPSIQVPAALTHPGFEHGEVRLALRICIPQVLVHVAGLFITRIGAVVHAAHESARVGVYNYLQQVFVGVSAWPQLFFFVFLFG